MTTHNWGNHKLKQCLESTSALRYRFAVSTPSNVRVEALINDIRAYVEPSAACEPGNLRRQERRPWRSSKISQWSVMRRGRRLQKNRKSTCSAPVSFTGRLFTNAFVNLVMIKLSNMSLSEMIHQMLRRWRCTWKPCHRNFSSISSVPHDPARSSQPPAPPAQAHQHTLTLHWHVQASSMKCVAWRVEGHLLPPPIPSRESESLRKWHWRGTIDEATDEIK